MALSLPDADTRWRCAGCGNLTRFDVTRTRRTTEFWHFDLAGGHRVEEARTDREDVASVTCRWCGRSDAVELVGRADVDPTADPAGDPGGDRAAHPGLETGGGEASSWS